MDGFQITTVYENTIRISHGVGNICGGQSKTTVVFASCFISVTCVLNGRKVMTLFL